MSKDQVKIDTVKIDTAKTDYTEMVNKLMDCKSAGEAMVILHGKKVPEIKVIMQLVKAEKDKAMAAAAEAEAVKAEVEDLLHATYGRPAILPRAEVITNKTRLAVWIFQSNPSLTKDKFIAEFIRIRDSLKLSFTDKDASERYSACYNVLRRDSALAEKYGKTYKGLFAL